ncbi:MAG: T9SS type A sorting domain-containing protein [Bacteroidales bacterium]
MKKILLPVLSSLIISFFPFSEVFADGKSSIIRIDNFFSGPIHKTLDDYQLKGEIVYMGNDTVQSLIVNYKIGDDFTGSETLADIEILPYYPFRYVVDETWPPENEGSYEVSIWFSGLNGSDPDEAVSDTMKVNVDVYDELAERQMALLESFSSINCGSCAAVTPHLRKIVDENPDSFAMIYYHPLHYENSPLHTFNPKDQLTRRDYYEVFYTPYSVIGNLYEGGSEGVTDELMELEIIKWSGFSVEGTWYVEDDTLHIFAEGEIFVNTQDKDYRLMLAGTQESVHFDDPPGSNGEKDFYHVMRFFAPDAQGTKLLGEEDKTTFSYQISMPWYETLDPENMTMIAFIQELNTSEISQVVRLDYQAPDDDDDDDTTYISELSDDKNPFLIYPNPANQYIRLKGDYLGMQPQQIMLFDLQGRLIKTQSFNDHVDISDISAGIYYLYIQTGDHTFTEKISIVR